MKWNVTAMRKALFPFIAATAVAMSYVCLPSYVAAQETKDEASAPFDYPQRADGARVTPDKILRGYDPITVFFTSDAGSSSNKVEDSPEKYVTLLPKTQGEWRWLGPRALQFRPAEAWAPLSHVTVKLGRNETRLVALLPTPISAIPEAGMDPAPEITQVSLTFAQPVDVSALSRLLTVEVRPSPGISSQGGQILNSSAYDIIAAERKSRADPQSYIIRFHERIADGRIVFVKLKLSDEPGLGDEIYELRALTAPPFSVSSYSCGSGWSEEEMEDLLRCESSGGNNYGDSSEFSPADKRRIVMRFTSQPQAIDIIRAREAFRITPPVDDLAVEIDDKRLKLGGKFLSDQVYTLSINAGALRDNLGRTLVQPFTKRFAFTKDTPSLQWDAGYGIVERYGPQFLPLRGRGYDHADIRIHAIDPLSRDFWPFPAQGVVTNDEDAPPMPGQEPKNWREADSIKEEDIKLRLKALGSPSVSRIAQLPIRRGGADARFGLDLSADFARINGREQPGVYLVGLRNVDAQERKWLRVQVTDLSLSTIEEPSRVGFVVTSLADERPVSGAQVRIEGIKDDKLTTLGSGATDNSGFFAWTPPKKEPGELVRVVVTKGVDTLVVDPDSAPAEYANELWSKPETPWLSWTSEDYSSRKEKPRTLCHVFSERPIYRPEEFAHIKGFVRKYSGGALSLPKDSGTLVITGPGQQEWRIPVKLDGSGNFYHKFDAQTPATGEYNVRYETDEKVERNEEEFPKGGATPTTAPPENISCGQFSFKKEAYRLPTFEVLLNAPSTVSLDSSFNVDLLARYFSGGLAADRPVKWRAVQFPYVYTPPHREGFFFSSDSRFSGETKFRSDALLEREQKTDAGGAARISFDTTIEPTSQPRRYSIEATVTGDDGVEVRNVQNIIALPPFVLGVKTLRYVERPGSIAPEVLAIDGKGDAVEGLEMTLRLIRRNWISTLQASDFAQGAAKYVTQTQDEVLLERKITSTKEAQKVQLEAREAGVYVVQLEAYDKLKRRQQVSVDFFVGGDTPVTFSRPPAQTATITSDKEKYAPGEAATLIIQSPFQNAHALAIVEQPSGVYDYEFVDIKNGYGRYVLPVKKEQMPKLAVHFLIMRGRLKNAELTGAAGIDQGKPVTIAATKWIDVTPVKHSITVKIDAPNKARPGQDVEVGIRLTDDTGKPLSGDVTFWMVDQAVLSLAKEQPLEPLPDFIVLRETQMSARDTRNMAFGVIPLEETTGGDGGEQEEWGAETNISVRKNFTPVPIYVPSLKVGADGYVKVKVKLPDSLTVFKLRAKATSGADRFGATGSELLIRQDIIAQPVLPRFVRPGDVFDIGLVARVIEGAASSGSAMIASSDVKITGDASYRLSWEQNKAARIDVRGDVPVEKKDEVKIDFKVSRDTDHAKDAVQIEVPVKPDREPKRQYQIVEIAPGETKNIAASNETARQGTFRRRIIVASDPAIVKLVAGLNYLVSYPYGCTEQRLALARAGLALKSFSPILSWSGLDKRISDIVHIAAQSIDQSVDGNGLVAFWPRSKGNVSLTAWSYMFLNQAARNGETIDKPLLERLRKILETSLRSDYTHLIGGEEMRERVTALSALADGGTIDQAYVSEFLRNANFLPSESLAEMVMALTRVADADQRIASSLMDAIWSRIKFVNREGQQVYYGQAGGFDTPVLLASETRSLAEISRASARAAPTDPRSSIIKEALLRLGEGDGWGDTNANAAAIEALAEAWRKPTTATSITFRQADAVTEKMLDGDHPAVDFETGDTQSVSITNPSNAKIIALVESSSVPTEPGYQAKAESSGFAITRQSWRIKNPTPPQKIDAQDGVMHVAMGEVVEEIIEVVNPENRRHVAITIPLAAGYEPLNPHLTTSPAEAQPSFVPTLEPSWVSFKDDRVFYAYDDLPKGNYRFAFRVRAQTHGTFTQPSALVETMYKKGLQGATTGVRVEISK